MDNFDLLKDKCAQRFGRTPRTTNDFEEMSASMLNCQSQAISASTLKRLWGYVDNQNETRRSTLDVMAAYCGFESYDRFCTHHQANESLSDFYSPHRIVVEDLVAGQSLVVGWPEKRRLKLKYCDDGWFEVMEAENSKIVVGDRVRACGLAIDQPLMFSFVIRNGLEMASYVAAKERGITLLQIET